jgi:hypothetical protein
VELPVDAGAHIDTNIGASDDAPLDVHVELDPPLVTTAAEAVEDVAVPAELLDD